MLLCASRRNVARLTGVCVRGAMRIATAGTAQAARAASAAQHTPQLQPPPDLRLAASPSELAALLPSSYPIAAFRRRSIEARGVRVSFKPHFPGEVPGSHAPPGGPAADGSGAMNDSELPRAPSDSYLEVGTRRPALAFLNPAQHA